MPRQRVELQQHELKIASELKYLMAQIDTCMIELRDSVFASDFITAEVFPLPVVAEGEEHNKITEIPVSYAQGESAFFMAFKAFRKFYADDGASKKAAFRLPGFIQVNGDRLLILKHVRHLNELKEAFKDTVQQLDGAKRKHDVIHNLFPGLITKQLYRRLHCIDENISSLGFCWAQRYVTYKTTKKEIEAKIKKQQEHPPVGCDKEDWIAFLNREITDVKRLPEGSELRIKRQAKVNPVVNMDCEAKPQLSAHLPIIVVQKNPISVTPLTEFNSLYRRSVRSDSTIGGKPIVKRLHLYLKKAPSF